MRELSPPLNAIVPGFDGSAEIRFSEPISGARNLEQGLVASPAARYQVSAGFSNLKLRPRDGWIEGAVYYLQIPAGIADLLGNRTEDPIELVFSTGPEISATQVTGEVSRRIDQASVAEGRVVFFNVAGDSIPYSAVTDRQGEFRLPFLPPDDYWAFAFEDFNRNLQLDRAFEPHDSARFVLAAGGFESLSFRTVDPDSTPPLLVRASAQDSLSIRLEFDDYLDPDQDLAAIPVRVRHAEGGVLEVVEVRLEEMPQSDSRRRRATRREERPAEDADRERIEAMPDTSAVEEIGQPDEAEPDSIAEVRPDSAGAGPAAEGKRDPPADEETAQEEGLPLPSQWLRIEVASALQDGSYRVRVDSVLNLRGLAGSADTTFVFPEPMPEDGRPEAEPPAGEPVDDEPPADEPADDEPPADEPPEDEPTEDEGDTEEPPP